MNAALAELQNSLHVSHGQVFSYLACSLKYRFQYVERRPPERLSISLPFGKAIHASLERYYLGLQQGIALLPTSANLCVQISAVEVFFACNRIDIPTNCPDKPGKFASDTGYYFLLALPLGTETLISSA